MSRQQLGQIKQMLVEYGIHPTETADSKIVVRGVHKDVGDIVIQSENDTITVFVGEYYHQHLSPDESSCEGIRRLADFVRDVVNDRIHFTVRFLNKQPVSVHQKNPDTGESSVVAFAVPKSPRVQSLLSPFRKSRETFLSFRWSGPLTGNDSPGQVPVDDGTRLADTLLGINADQMKQLADYLSQQVRTSGDQSE